MKNSWLSLIVILGIVLELSAGTISGRSGAVPRPADESPIVTAWGSQLTVYYPSQQKVYVYSELGGNCVFAYTLTTPGGPISRENCK